MKRRMWLAGAAMLFLLMPEVSIWAQESVIAKGEEEIYGTWANENNRADVLHGQKVVVGPDAMRIFCKVSDPECGMEVSWDITSKWTDSEGNVWYKTLGTSTGGLYLGAKWQTLEKVSKSGKIWERAMNLLETGRFHPAFYPRTMDPKGIYYRVLYRIEG
jgi:hypothetical protein